MTSKEPTTAEIQAHHNLEEAEGSVRHGITAQYHKHRGILLKRMEADKATIKELEEKLLASKAIYLSVTCAEDLAEFDKLNAQIKEQEAKLKRLESRGFEDLHHENEQLKAKLKAVSELSEYDFL